MRQGAQEEQGLLYTLFRKGMDCEPDKRKSPVHACGKAVRKILEVTDGWQYKVIMRMDMVESILRRDALGIGLEEVLEELENSI